MSNENHVTHRLVVYRMIVWDLDSVYSILQNEYRSRLCTVVPQSLVKLQTYMMSQICLRFFADDL